jgi:hypothetical protein
MPDEPDPSQPGWAAPTPPPPPPPPGESPPPAAPAPPPGWGAPPPPGAVTGRPRRRRRWPWVLGGVLGAIAILAISGTVLFVQKVKPPIDATNDFLDEVEDGNLDAAIDMLCAEDQGNIDEDDLFLGALATSDDLEVNWFGVDVDGDRATVDLTSDEFDDDTVFELPLRKEDGDWRPCLSDIELR